MYGQQAQQARRRNATGGQNNGSAPGRFGRSDNAQIAPDVGFPAPEIPQSSTNRPSSQQSAVEIGDTFELFASQQPQVGSSGAFFNPSSYSYSQPQHQPYSQQMQQPSNLMHSNSTALPAYSASSTESQSAIQNTPSFQSLHGQSHLGSPTFSYSQGFAADASPNVPRMDAAPVVPAVHQSLFQSNHVRSEQQFHVHSHRYQQPPQHHESDFSRFHQPGLVGNSVMSGQDNFAPPSSFAPGSDVRQFIPPQPPHQPVSRQQAPSFAPASASTSSVGVGMPGVPLFLAGMAQQFVGNGNLDAGQAAAVLAPQLLNNLGVQDYFPGSAVGDAANTFMRFPKYYFAVNHSYVVRKLALLLMPFTRRNWSRKRTVDQVQFDAAGADGAGAYLPPRDDLNAPDLYIPVMSFVSYVLMVGFLFGTRDAFSAEVLAKYCSKGLGVLTLEVLIIKLGLYLINARPTPWLDVIAYRGYKFVGVMLAMLACFVFPKLYYPALLYSATAMALFLMHSHRRIILPREADHLEAGDLTQRNIFLLFLCLLQYPTYWLLILDSRSIVT